MLWHPDVPDLPITKPQIIEDLEQTDSAVLNAMPPAEVEDTINSVAYAVAKAYSELPNGDHEGCFEFASIALSTLGSAIGGKFGTSMVAACDRAARDASSIVFPEE